MLQTLSKGQEMLLDIKDSARRRVICGLRWDPMGDSGAAAGRQSICMILTFYAFALTSTGVSSRELPERKATAPGTTAISIIPATS